MLLVGLGIGPAATACEVGAQAAVQLSRMGVASGTLTLCWRMGASVGLAFAGTIFNVSFTDHLRRTLVATGVPNPVVTQLTRTPVADRLTSPASVSGTLAELLPSQLQPLIPDIVTRLHQAVALAIGNLFWFAMGAGALALLCALLIEEKPLSDRR
jgi:hypothetical protein